MFAVLYYVLNGSSCSAAMCRSCLSADDATEPGDGILTNLHVTDLNIEGPVPNQTCMFGQVRELDLDAGAMTGTIPFFLTQCFPFVNEIDLSYNQVEAPYQSNNCVCVHLCSCVLVLVLVLLCHHCCCQCCQCLR